MNIGCLLRLFEIFKCVLTCSLRYEKNCHEHNTFKNDV